MGANVDLQLFTATYIGITPVIQCLSELHYDAYIYRMLVINDWKWNGEQTIDINSSSEEIHNFVLHGKIVLIYF